MATEQQEEVREFSLEQTIIWGILTNSTSKLEKGDPSSSEVSALLLLSHQTLAKATFFMDKYSYFWQDKAT